MLNHHLFSFLVWILIQSKVRVPCKFLSWFYEVTGWKHHSFMYACMVHFVKNTSNLPSRPFARRTWFTHWLLLFSFVLIIYYCFVCHPTHRMQYNQPIVFWIVQIKLVNRSCIYHFLCNTHNFQLRKEPSLWFLPKLLIKPVAQMLWNDRLGFQEYGWYVEKMLTTVYSILLELWCPYWHGDKSNQ